MRMIDALGSARRLLTEHFVEKRLFPTVLLAILAIKLWAAFQYRVAVWDGYVYLLNARRFLYGYDPYSYFETFRPPLVPYMISLIWRVTGENYFAAVPIQPIFTVAAAYLLFLLVKRAFGFKAAIVASLFMLSIPDAFVWTNNILVHGEGLFFAIGSVYFFWRAYTGEPRYYAPTGAFLGLATLARYAQALLLPVFAFFLLATLYHRRFNHEKTGTTERRWIILGLLLFLATWLPWLIWNSNFPYTLYLYVYLYIFPLSSSPYPFQTPWYFYFQNLPYIAVLGVPGVILLLIGLVNRRTLRDRFCLLLVLWIVVSLMFYTTESNRQLRFYTDWAPPLAAFVGLGVSRLEKFTAHRTKVLAWVLIAVWLAATFGFGVKANLMDVKSNESAVGSYDEFMQIVGWVTNNTKHSDIGAADIAPYLSYTTNRYFYDIVQLQIDAHSKGLTTDEYMQTLAVKVIVVRTSYAQDNGLLSDPNLQVAKTFPDFVIFRLG